MNITEYSIILLFSLLSGLTTLIGWGLAYLCKKSCGLVVMGTGFSTGIMILISFFELLPEAANELPIVTVLFIAACGAPFSMIANRAIPHFHFMQEQES